MSRRKWKQTGSRIEHGVHARHGVPVADVLHPHLPAAPRGRPDRPASAAGAGGRQGGKEKAATTKKLKAPVDIKGVDTLTITRLSPRTGNRLDGRRRTEDGEPADLDADLHKAFKDANSPFEQVIIQSSPKLRYGELMRVVEVCASQTMPTERS